MHEVRCWGIMPAGGESRRMGSNKLELPVAGQTVLARISASMNASLLDGTLVVLGPRSRHLAAEVAPPAEAMLLESQTPDMRSTIEAGITWCKERHSPMSEDGILVVPADQPMMSSATIDIVVRTYRERPGAIVVPTFGGKRGHPVVFPWSIIKRLGDLPADVGLNALVRQFNDDVHSIEVDDGAVLEDLDEPGDYEALKTKLKE